MDRLTADHCVGNLCPGRVHDTGSILIIGQGIMGLGCLGSSAIILCKGVLGIVPMLANLTGDGSDITTDLSG